MKRIIFLFIIAQTIIILYSQAPDMISYQAVIRNANNELITNKNVSLKISILQDDPEGDAVYIEWHTAMTNSNGLVTVKIGGGNVISGAFSTIDWSDGPYFIKTETDPSGGADYTIVGISQLLSVPYAFYAETTGTDCEDTNHYVGELFGGGIVFYVFDRGKHGLIASLDDLSAGIEWGGNGIDIYDSRSQYDGESNTTEIIDALGTSSSYPALLCDIYTDGEYNDWYLPSIWEMNLLYNQAYLISIILNNDESYGTNGISFFDPYWSSTERNSDDAWAQFCGYGFVGPDNHEKTNLYRVRAVRKF